jgi:hypothetical protein
VLQLVCSPLLVDARAWQQGQTTKRIAAVHADALKLCSEGYSQGKHVGLAGLQRPPAEEEMGVR